MSAKNFKPFFLNSNLSFGRAGGDTVENLLRSAAKRLLKRNLS